MLNGKYMHQSRFRNMDKFNPGWAKSLPALGVALAFAGALADFGASKWNEHALAEVVAKCRSESADGLAKANKATPEWMQSELVCDGKALNFLDNPSNPNVGIQKVVRGAYLDVKYDRYHFGWVLYFLASLTVVPWIWYWFLRRLREIRQALTE